MVLLGTASPEQHRSGDGIAAVLRWAQRRS
jgi:hypothetical protein